MKRLVVGLLCVQSLSLSATDLAKIQKQAEKRGLPTPLFEDIKSFERAQIKIFLGKVERPRYYPFFNRIVLPYEMAEPAEWRRFEWAQFYNELFHAWWDEVFSKHPSYAPEYRRLINLYSWRYQEVNPRDIVYAQEETYSETVSSFISVMAMEVPQAKLYWRKGFTVATAAHHEEQPTKFEIPEEPIFPNRAEYRKIFRYVTGKNPPSVPTETDGNET